MSDILENLLSFINNYKFVIIFIIIFFIVYLYRKKLKTIYTKKRVINQKKDCIQSDKFIGSKKGYVFKKGEKGLGYYLDI